MKVKRKTMKSSRFVTILALLMLLVGCQSNGGATALAPAVVPEGWKKESVGNAKMNLALPAFFSKDSAPNDSPMAQMAKLFSDVETLSRIYIGPDAKGRECMVMVTAFSHRDNGTNPEGAANEYVDMMVTFSFGEQVKTTKRQVDLPVGPAWRAVVTSGSGASATSTILYAGKTKGQYYQVMFMESGSGDIVLVPDKEIMETLRFE